MTKWVVWTKQTLEDFIELGALTELEEKVIRGRVAGKSRIQQCDALGISTATLDRIIRALGEKYDTVQKSVPTLPERRRGIISLS